MKYSESRIILNSEYRINRNIIADAAINSLISHYFQPEYVSDRSQMCKNRSIVPVIKSVLELPSKIPSWSASFFYVFLVWKWCVRQGRLQLQIMNLYLSHPSLSPGGRNALQYKFYMTCFSLYSLILSKLWKCLTEAMVTGLSSQENGRRQLIQNQRFVHAKLR